MNLKPSLNEIGAEAIGQQISKLNENISKIDQKLAFIELGLEAPEDDEKDTSSIRAQKRRSRGLESEYKCTQCQKYFYSSSTLNRHMRTVHPDANQVSFFGANDANKSSAS